MTIFPYIKVIRKGILYSQEINKPFLFTDFHVPTNKYLQHLKTQSFSSLKMLAPPPFFFFCLRLANLLQQLNLKKNTNKQNNCYFRIETKQKKSKTSDIIDVRRTNL